MTKSKKLEANDPLDQLHDYWFKKIVRAFNDYEESCAAYQTAPKDGTFATVRNKTGRFFWHHNGALVESANVRSADASPIEPPAGHADLASTPDSPSVEVDE